MEVEKLPRSKNGGGPGLLHPEERRLRLLAAYYDVLGMDPVFDSDLRRLYVSDLATLDREPRPRKP